MKMKLLGLLLGSLITFGAAWAEDPKEDARKDPPPPREGDRDGNRRVDRDRPPPRDLRREGDREGDRPDFRRPPHDREGDRRGEGDRPPPRDLRREGDREGGDRGGRFDGGGEQRAQQELERRDAMIDGLRRELGRVHEQNAELKRFLKLLEQRISKLENK